jgi:hypothetical protein
MSVLQDWLEERMKVVDIEKYQPTMPVRDGEEIIHVIDDVFTKKLFCVLAQHHESLIERSKEIELDYLHNIISGKAFEDADEGHIPEECPDCIISQKLRPMIRRRKFIEDYFWATIAEEISGEDPEDLRLAIREDWKIVVVPENVLIIIGPTPQIF